jgi:phosphatidylserine decarboxylase
MRPTYLERGSGRLRQEDVYAGGLLRLLYASRAGRLLEPVLAGSPLFSRAAGAWQETRLSRHRIEPFAERYRIDPSEAERPLDAYRSFADFFRREAAPGRRPLDPDPDVVVSPADGKVFVVERVEPDRPFRIKRSIFDLGTFLGDAGLARRFAGGALAVIRLTLRDLHRFVFPLAGTPGPALDVPGRYHAGGPYARGWLVPFFAENHRQLTRLDSARCGLVLMAEVGALTVGSIRQTFVPGLAVERGEAKGYFEPGGSTIVLLFEPGRIAFDADLLAASARDLETAVLRGQSLGRPGGGR